MSAPRVTSRPTAAEADEPRGSASAALTAAVLGFFVITLDALVVNVALPDVRDDLGGGMTGLQRVVDGYTLMFAALLLSAGSFSDRMGAHRTFGTADRLHRCLGRLWPGTEPGRAGAAWGG
jgi:MFS family permease